MDRLVAGDELVADELVHGDEVLEAEAGVLEVDAQLRDSILHHFRGVDLEAELDHPAAAVDLLVHLDDYTLAVRVDDFGLVDCQILPVRFVAWSELANMKL